MSNPSAAKQSPQHQQRLWIIVLAAVVAITFGRIAGNDFLYWDDHLTIFHNPHFNPSVTLANVLWYWWPGHAVQGLWVPFTQTVWAVLCMAARVNAPDQHGSTLNPAVFHIASIAVHYATAIVVFQILRLLIARDLPAFLGAILFAIHPVQVETVAWASGLKDLLCGFLSLLAVWQYLLYVHSSRRRHMIIATLAFVLGMLSKPTAVVTPLLAIAVDLLALQRPWRTALRTIWPWLILMIPCVIWTKLAQSGVGVPTVNWYLRPLVATDALAFYLYKLIWPVNLCTDYGRRPLVALHNGWLFYTWIAPVILGILCWRFRRRSPLLLLSACVFVIGLGPVLGLSPFMFQYFSTVADHYLYIPMFGAAIAMAWLAARIPPRFAAFLLLIFALLIGRSIAQEGYWSDNFTFFNHIIAINPDSFLAYNNRSILYRMQNQMYLAEKDVQKAVAINPNFPLILDNLAAVQISTGRPEDAINTIKRMLDVSKSFPPELQTNLSESEHLLGLALLQRKQYAEALRYLEDAHNRSPDDEKISADLARAKQLLKE